MALESMALELISSKLEKFAKWCKGKYDEYMIPTSEHFQEYLERSYNKYSIINTLVFHNSQRHLKDIYVAQTLVKENRTDDADNITRIDRLPVSLIKKYKRILITDTAGMGKSTIMKRMFVDLFDNGVKDVGIPIYIELNRLKKNHTILMEIQKEINSLSKEFDQDLYLKLIQTGGFIFFLDGYDEISIADRSEVNQDIQDFVSKAGARNYYILTSRPEDSLTSFGDFQSFNIQPLTKKEAFELLRKYDSSKKKVISGKLVELLKSGKYDSINEYLENPLLVSLLFAAFDHKQSIPLKKHLFYRQVYEAYFDSHDLSKGISPHLKRTGLDIDDFNRVLRYVGYECLIRIGVQFDKDSILGSIDRAKAYCGNLDFGSNDFLKDLLTAVPLFSKDGPEYKWAHKSLMEYFAARFIAEDAKENQDKILTSIYNSEHVSKYMNMLDLYYDIDFKGFSKNITLPLCESFIEFYDNNYFSSNISRELIEQRISYLFLFLGKIAFLISHNFSVKNARRLFDQAKLGFDESEITHQIAIDEIVFFVKNFSDKRNALVTLLNRKSLINVRRTNKFEEQIKWRANGFPEVFCGFERDKVYAVNVKTGCENELLYDSVTQLIVGRWQLDYEACKKEVERIRHEIDKSNDPSGLLDGI